MDVTRLGGQHVLVAHRGLGNLGPLDRHRQRIFEPAAHDFDVDGGALRPLEAVDRVVERHGVRRLALDGADDVACAHPQAGRGRALDRAHHRDLSVTPADQDAQAIEGTGLLLAHAGVGTRREEAGVRIQGSKHALDRREDQLAVRDLAAVSLVRHRDQLGVETEVVARLLGECEDPVADQGSRESRDDEENGCGDAPRSLHESSVHGALKPEQIRCRAP